MSNKVTVMCDRCTKTVEGIYDPNTKTTGGFYRVAGELKENSWAKYRNWGEKILCDACMWADKRYKKDYGTVK